MPQLHPTRRTGRRLLTAGLLGAVVVLGTPAVASAAPSLPSLPIPLPGVPGSSAAAGSTTVSPAAGDGLPSLPGLPGAPDFAGTGQAFATCLTDAGADITVALTGLGTGLQDALLELLGGGLPSIPELPLPVNPTSGTAQGQFTLSQADLESLAAEGETELLMVVTVLVNGVEQVVQVVVDLATCLAALIPTAAPAAPTTTNPPPSSAAPTTPPAPAITTSAAPTQAVAYPGYAPTGGAPSEEDGSPAALVGLGLLTAATGGGALWLRARRGVA